MKDLYCVPCFGCGRSMENGKIESPNEYLPEEIKYADGEIMNLLIFGGYKDKVTNGVFPVRDPIAYLLCNYLGKNRDKVRSGHLCDACDIAKTTIPDCDNKDLIVISGLNIDFYTASQEELESMFFYVYNLMDSFVKERFDANADIAVVMLLNKEEFELVKKINDWGEEVKAVISNEGFVALFK